MPYHQSVFLVSCVSQKRSEPALAKDLYVSALFTKARRYVEAGGGPWFILSAKYGLVAPDQVLDPYNETLNKMGVAERREWAKFVQSQMDQQLPNADRVVILAGKRYREFLMDYLTRRYRSVEIPMDRLKIGEQLHWLCLRDGQSIRV